MKNSNFGKTGENVQNYKDIKFLTAEKRRNSSASEANYYITKLFTEKILTLEVKNNQILMNKLVYLGYSQYYNWEKLQYMSFGMIRKNMVKKKNFLMWIKIVLLHNTWKQMIFIKTLQKILKQGLIMQFMNWTNHYWKSRTRILSVLWCDELGGKIMKEIVELTAKIYSYFIGADSEDKKAKVKFENLNLKIISTV